MCLGIEIIVFFTYPNHYNGTNCVYFIVVGSYGVRSPMRRNVHVYTLIACGFLFMLMHQLKKIKVGRLKL